MSDKGEAGKGPVASPKIPSELTQQAKAEWALEEFGKKVGVSATVAGMVSLVLFRSPLLRVATFSLGVGFGSGWSYKIINDEFSKKK